MKRSPAKFVNVFSILRKPFFKKDILVTTPGRLLRREHHFTRKTVFQDISLMQGRKFVRDEPSKRRFINAGPRIQPPQYS